MVSYLFAGGLGVLVAVALMLWFSAYFDSRKAVGRDLHETKVVVIASATGCFIASLLAMLLIGLFFLSEVMPFWWVLSGVATIGFLMGLLFKFDKGKMLYRMWQGDVLELKKPPYGFLDADAHRLVRFFRAPGLWLFGLMRVDSYLAYRCT